MMMIKDQLNEFMDVLDKAGKDTEFDLVLEAYRHIPDELKHKKDIPTVIEYQGRRYVLDYGNNK